MGACAFPTGTYRDLDPRDTKRGEGVAIGRVRVRFNDQFYTKECSVCINRDVPGGSREEERCTNLEANGVVIMPFRLGPARLSNLQCGADWHSLPKASFVVQPGGTFFGEAVVEWKQSPTFGQRLAVAAASGAVGMAIFSAMKKPGKFVVTVDEDNPWGIINAYREWARDPRAKVISDVVEPDAE